MLIYVGSYSFLLAFGIFILTELNIVSWIILALKTTSFEFTTTKRSAAPSDF